MSRPPRTTRLAVALFVAGATLSAAPAGAAPMPDPTVAGPHSVTVVEYNVGPTVVVGGNEVWLDELRGALFVPSGPGPFPVLLFLHGLNSNCESPLTPEGGQDPSRPFDTSCGFAPRIPHHRGFDYLANNLASHGFLVASVLSHATCSIACGGGLTDGGANVRAEILARTLDLLGEWNRGPRLLPDAVGATLVGRVDLTRIGAMGHSRGGEGATALTDQSRQRVGTHYRLSGVMGIAETEAFTGMPHGVPYGVIVPACDGDVYDYDGAYLYDRGRFVDPAEPAPRMLYVVRGANHNYANSLWATWDGADDGVWYEHGCSAAGDPLPAYRLSAAEEQRIMLALVAGFFRRYVGGETAFDPLLTGAAALPASACPHGDTRCADAVATSYLAPAADRTMVVTGDSATATDLGGTLSLTGFAEARVCEPTSNRYPFVDLAVVAHYTDQLFDLLGSPRPADALFPAPTDLCPSDPTRSAARQLALRWDSTAVLTADLVPSPLATFDASRFTALTFRTAVNVPVYGNPAPDIDVVLRDADGRTATVAAAAFTSALRPPDGPLHLRVVLGGVRLPLGAFHGIRLDRLTRAELRFGRTGPGSVELAEMAFQVA